MCVHKHLRTTNNELESSLEDECDYVDIENAIDSNSGDMTIIQHNIRGLNSKIGDLSYLLSNIQTSGQPDIPLICESWLKSSCPKPILDGYSLERSDRKWKKGGGVCIFVSTCCKYSRRPDLEAYNCDSFESCFDKEASWLYAELCAHKMWSLRCHGSHVFPIFLEMSGKSSLPCLCLRCWGRHVFRVFSRDVGEDTWGCWGGHQGGWG